jgi:hypothetical protein
MPAIRTRSYQPAIVLGTMVIAILAIQIGIGLASGVIGGGLPDSDPYMWLNRVQYLHDRGDWFQSVYPRIDPPFGYEQHWTRPFDSILLLGGSIGGLFFGFEKALYHWALYLSPLFQLLSLFALLWALAPWYRSYGDHWSIGVIPAIFLSQVAIIANFLIGRTDHQILLFFLFTLLIGFTIRLLTLPYRPIWAYAAGAVAALGIWVSVEFLPAIFVSFASLFLFWLMGETDKSRKLFAYSLSLLFTSGVALLLQRGFQGLSTPVIDQISVIHLAMFGLLLCVSAVSYALDRSSGKTPSVAKKSAILAGLGVCSAAALAALYPELMLGPWGNLDSLYAKTHLPNISELQPLLALHRLPEEWLQELSRFTLWLGIALPAVPILLGGIRTSRGSERHLLTYLGLGALVYVPLAVAQIRWVPYAILFVLPVYALLFNRILASARRWQGGPSVSLGRAFLMFLLLMWPFAPTLVSAASGLQTKATTSTKSCQVLPLVRALNDSPIWTERGKNLMAFFDLGPALLYHSPHSVYSIPSHRYHQGFTDTYRIMTATDDVEAHDIVEKRNVELILVCKEGPELRFFNREDGAETFHARLVRDSSTSWLRPVALPSDISSTFNLYEVIRP